MRVIFVRSRHRQRSELRAYHSLDEESCQCRLLERGLVGPACRRDRCASRPLPQRLGGGFRPALIDLVGGAEGKLRARFLESFREVAAVSSTASMPPASNRLGETRPRIEVGRPPETGEEHLRPRAVLLAIEVAFVAQTLEGLGLPHRRERHCVRWKSREARQRQNGGLGFVEIEVARADERIRPARDVGSRAVLTLATACWIDPVSARLRRAPPSRSIFWNRPQAASPIASVSASIAPTPRRDRRRGGYSLPRSGSSAYCGRYGGRRRREVHGGAERQDRNRIGAAGSRAQCRDRAAHDVPVRVALVIMRQAVSAETKKRWGAARMPPRCAPTASGSRGTWRW